MNRSTQDEAGGSSDSYLASVSDLMSGLIFVFIIALMIFALRLEYAAKAKEAAEEELTNTERIRADLLLYLEASLREKGVEVKVDPNHGILRLPEEFLFDLSQADLNESGRANMPKLRCELESIIPCYAGSETPGQVPAFCEGQHAHPGRLDTILIEGHADEQNLKPGRFESNLDLSAKRAMTVFQALTQGEPCLTGANLEDVRNRDGQPVLGVSGYGSERPRIRNAATDDEHKQNRRIDLRFVMMPPRVTSSELQETVHMTAAGDG